MKTSKKVGGTKKSTQAMGDLNKTPYNTLISSSVLKAVSKTVREIDKALADEMKHSFNLGGLLARLKNEMSDHFYKLDTPPTEYQVKIAFHNFVQIRFKIGENRTKEYIRLSECKDLHKLGLPTSVLIELSRLNSVDLMVFKSKYPSKELKNMSFKEIKKLIRAENSKKRYKNPARNKAVAETPEEIANNLKTTFKIVRKKFDDIPSIDKEVDVVLSEISKWYVDKRVA